MTSDDPIAAFYQRFPYPPRGKGRGEKNLDWIIPGSLPEVAHHVFGGVLPRGRPFRVLIAGGGTGNAVVSLGGWMGRLGIAGSIDYLDLSPSSCAIARARAEAAGVANASFQVGPIEALADGPADVYDYIDFCGVLNHVPDQASALAALSHALAPGGGIGVMAYGRLGRTGVYEAQTALSMLGVDGTRSDGVALARSFLTGLPARNWLSLNPGFADLAKADDIEIADVLLNPRDRAFTTTELDDLMTGAGLRIRCFCPPYLYDPAAALRNPTLKAAAAALDRRSQWQLAEFLQGSFRKHVLYATKPVPGAVVGEPDADPVGRLLGEPDTLLVPANIDLPALAASIADAPDGRYALQFKVDGRELSIGTRFTPLDLAIMGAFDGPTRVGEILNRLESRSSDVPGALRALQPRLTKFRMLYVMAG